jgi:hypothetical protein
MSIHTAASGEPQNCDFHIGAFAVDGNLLGLETSQTERLSRKWLAICKEYLDQHGSSFDETWSGKLSHIRTKLTAAAGVALVTFSANGRIVASLALASGQSAAAENSVLEMFAKSLRDTPLVRAVTRSPDAFQQILQIEERPLMIVVPWPDDATSDQDHKLVQELSLHLAAAFLLGRS